jgi:hypothetical protein
MFDAKKEHPDRKISITLLEMKILILRLRLNFTTAGGTLK